MILFLSVVVAVVAVAVVSFLLFLLMCLAFKMMPLLSTSLSLLFTAAAVVSLLLPLFLTFKAAPLSFLVLCCWPFQNLIYHLLESLATCKSCVIVALLANEGIPGGLEQLVEMFEVLLTGVRPEHSKVDTPTRSGKYAHRHKL